MIRYLRHSEINKNEWDKLIEQSPQRQVYALSWYLDVVSPDWDALVEQDRDGRYNVVMPIPNTSRYGIRYVQQPHFCQQLGMYSLEITISEYTRQQLVQELYQHFWYVVSLQFNTANTMPESLQLPQLEIGRSTTLYLDLVREYSMLYQAYTRDRKMNLKRAHKAELAIEESGDIEPLISFFRSETAERIYGGVNEATYDTLRKLYRELRQRGVGRLFYTVARDGRKNAGCLFIIWGGRIVYIFNASAREGRKDNGRTLILDHIIQQYAGKEYLLDFESPGAAEADIVHFYRSFGAVEVAFPVLRYNRMPGIVRFFKKVRTRVIRRLLAK